MDLFDSICDYLDKPRSLIFQDQHAHCAKRLEDVMARVEYFQTIVYPMKYGGIWQVDIYFSSGDIPDEWFGAACCETAALAMALEDFAE